MSELRNFRMNKANGKLATGRKRIRAMSDSSDDEQQQTSPQKSTQNGTTTDGEVKEREERFHTFRTIVDHSVDSMVLQDILVQYDWDVQKAFDALQKNPKYKNSDSPSPPALQSPTVSTKDSLNTSTEASRGKPKQKQKVRQIHRSN